LLLFGGVIFEALAVRATYFGINHIESDPFGVKEN
jgi:hypothetical protein